MKLGLGIGEVNAEKSAALAKEHGITGLMLGGWQFDGPDAIKGFAAGLDGLEICQWGAWGLNPMQPTPEAIEGAVADVRLAGELGIKTAVTHGGGVNPDHPYCGHPDNWTDAAIATVAESVKPLAKAAEESGTTVVLEPHFATALTTWDACAKILDAIGSDAAKIQFDPANMVRFDDYWDTAPLLTEGFATLKGRIGSAHAKDIRMENQLHLHFLECPAGEGCLDYVTYIRLLEQELGPDGYLIIEHTPEDKLAAAVAHVRACAEEAGVSIV